MRVTKLINEVELIRCLFWEILVPLSVLLFANAFEMLSMSKMGNAGTSNKQ
jgi:hypothetical protein